MTVNELILDTHW